MAGGGPLDSGLTLDDSSGSGQVPLTPDQIAMLTAAAAAAVAAVQQAGAGFASGGASASGDASAGTTVTIAD